MKRKRYKEAKAALLRRQQRVQRDVFFSNLDLDSCDLGHLFRLLRRANGGAPEPTTVLKVGETTFTGDGISEAWARYFEELACPKEDTNYDPVFAQSIQDQLVAIRSLPLGDFPPFHVRRSCGGDTVS